MNVCIVAAIIIYLFNNAILILPYYIYPVNFHLGVMLYVYTFR